MADLIQYIKEEASRNLRLAEKTKGSRQRTHSIRAKHLQRAVAEIERLTTERDTAEANLERLQNKFEQVTGENVRLTAEVKRLMEAIEEIASQAREVEMDVEDLERADFEQGYDMCVLTAREARDSGSPKPKGDKA